jgi:catechol 2,3-dioxygenase-like lactoylglutathione lyase family enzyme
VNVWYRVADLDAACAFYTTTLGFELVYRDEDGRWARLSMHGLELSISEERAGDPDVVFTMDVDDVRADAKRLRAAGVDVSTVVEIPSVLRIVDVFDPDGNRVQLSEEI